MAQVQQRRQRRKRLARRAVLSLLAGLVLAVLVAVVPPAMVSGWPNASFTRPGPVAHFIDADEIASPRTRDDPGRDVLARQWRLAGLVEQSWVFAGGIYQRQHRLRLEREFEQTRRVLERVRQQLRESGATVPPPRPAAPPPPPTTCLHDRTSGSRATLARLPDTSTILVRAGWPLRAAEGFTHEHGRSNLPAFTIAGRRLVVPTGPIWLGLAANTVVYALPILVLWAGPGLVRGAIRRRRGRCERCGYELAGLDRCPECGDFRVP